MTNIDVRIAIEKSRFRKFEIAEKMSVSDTSFSRMMRKELTPQQAERVYKAIEELKAGGRDE